MENFVVSARKYRPSTFESVIGQGHITNTLKNAIKNNQLAHAFLFCGPRGVGKTTCARILAKTINCSNITPEFEACNECDSCRSFNQNASFNIYELDAASNNSVDDIRGLVDQVRYAPQGAKYKIYIIDEVHMLSAAAFNAFLKTLEEPPPYAKFILATTERHKILPTILSRCQVFDFHRINIESAVMQLRKIIANEGIVAEEEALHVIAQKADGAMRDALSIFDRIVSFSGKNITYKDVIDNLNILDYEYYFRGVDMMLAKDLPAMLLLFDEVLTKGFDAQHFLSGFSDHLRNLMMCKHPNTHKLLEVAQSIAARFIQQSQQCSSSLLLNGLNILNKCELEYKSSKNTRLHVELTLMKLSHIQSIIDLNSGNPDAKKKITDVTAAPPVSNRPPQPEIVSTIASEPTISTPPIPPVSLQVALADEPALKIPIKPIGNNNAMSKLDKLRQQVTQTAQQTSNVTTIETEKMPVTYDADIPLTENSFSDFWKQYINKLGEQGKNSLSVIYKNATSRIVDASIIELTLASQHEREMIEEDKNSIIPFLRSNLKNALIDFTFIVNQTSQPFKAFTAEDRFKVMAEKNPMLNDLRQSFGLEFE
ncbi:MAG: DNA polymerase III subunit gamma/tau [Bacteroidota bacterium]